MDINRPFNLAEAAPNSRFLPSASEIDVRLRTDRGRYPIANTEPASIEIEVDKPAYLRVVYRTAEGKLIQLYPNGKQPQKRWHPGDTLQIPGNDALELRFGGPPAFGMLVALATSVPFEDEAAVDFSDGVYQSLDDGPMSEVLTRGINIEKRQPLFGSDIIAIEIFDPSQP